MKTLTLPGVLALLLCAAVSAINITVFDYVLITNDGQPAPLAIYKGKVIMIVNVASRCGFTPQYSALESIYEKYRKRGFVVIGIPANNFGREPGTNQEIRTFCETKYHVTFPMMARVSVKGSDQIPLYQYLTNNVVNPKTGGEIQWNFTKFLVGPDGRVIERFEPKVSPDSPEVITAINKALTSLKH
jgi:glutathione peroxidase